MAVDSDKSEHAARINDKHGVTTAVFKRLPLSSIKEFRFQVCPYYWVEFKNIAIKAGQKTEVQVVSPDAPTSPGSHRAEAEKKAVEPAEKQGK